MCLNAFPHTYNNTKICKYKTKIILDIDRNLILLSLNTFVGNSFLPSKIGVLQNSWNVVIQGENSDPILSMTVPS